MQWFCVGRFDEHTIKFAWLRLISQATQEVENNISSRVMNAFSQSRCREWLAWKAGKEEVHLWRFLELSSCDIIIPKVMVMHGSWNGSACSVIVASEATDKGNPKIPQRKELTAPSTASWSHRQLVRIMCNITISSQHFAVLDDPQRFLHSRDRSFRFFCLFCLFWLFLIFRHRSFLHCCRLLHLFFRSCSRPSRWFLHWRFWYHLFRFTTVTENRRHVASEIRCKV